MPLFIALITAAINGNEHKHEGWRLMLALPVSLTSLYVAKFLLGCLLTGLALIILWLTGLLGMALISAFGAPWDPSSGSVLLGALPAIALTSLPVLVIQHAVSWRFGNIIVPLSVAVIATMGIVQMGSSEYWVYYPWSYMMISALAGSEAMRLQAFWLAPAVAIVLLWLSTLRASVNKRAG